jgi:hypothetical protein
MGKYFENTLEFNKNHIPIEFAQIILKKHMITKYSSTIDLVKILKRYSPNHDWFIKKGRLDGIHGLRHIGRTIILSQLLCIELDEPEFMAQAVIASSLHDIGRKNDMVDTTHGKRGANWFRENSQLIENKYNIVLSEDEKQAIYYSILYHVYPYHMIENEKNYIFNKNLTDILKTSDALDRYRILGKSHWIKNDFLKIIPSLALKKFAFLLYIYTEESYINGTDSLNSVINGYKRLLKELKN